MSDNCHIEKCTKKIKNRKIIQNVFIGIFLIVFLMVLKGDVNSIHDTCPYAAVCFGAMLPSGIVTIPAGIILGIVILLVTIFMGRKFCSYFCFIGSIQEKIYSLNKGKRKFQQLLSNPLHRILLLLKYIILIVTFTLAVLQHQYIYMKFCPVVNLNFIFRIGLFALIFAAVFFILSLLVERFWCRYLCPYGALMNIFQLIGRLLGIKHSKVIRNLPQSLGCKNCQNYCPMQIDLKDDDIIDRIECIHCLRCVRICSKTKNEMAKCIYRDNI